VQTARATASRVNWFIFLAYRVGVIKKGVRDLTRIRQIPPDLVVKFQAIDIAEVILWLGLRLRVVYQQEIKG
jgi:hypothetical protein